MIRSGVRKLNNDGLLAIMAKGSGVALIVNILAYGTLFGLQILLTRTMGADGYGVYAYALSWVNLLILLVNLGFDTSTLRFAAAYNTTGEWALLRGIIRKSYQVVFVAGIIVGSLLAVGVWLFRGQLGSSLEKTFYVCGALLLFWPLLILTQSIIRSLKRVAFAMAPPQVLRPLLIMSLVSGAFFLFQKEITAQLAMTLNTISTLVVFCFMLYLLKKSLPDKSRTHPPRYETRKWLRVSLPMLLVQGMRVLLNQADILLVGIMIGTTNAGIYAIAARIAQLAALGLITGNVIAAPMISETYSKGDRTQLQRVLTLSSWAAAACAFFVLVIVAVAKSMILQVFGAEYTSGATALLILTLAYVINSCGGPIDHVLDMTGHQDLNVKIFISVIAVNFVLLYFLIHAYGIEGAAVATGLSMVAKVVWSWIEIKKRIGVNSSIISTIAR